MGGAPGVLAGLAAALCLGVADFCVQRVTQRAGWLKGLAWSQLLGVPLMVAVAWGVEGPPVGELASWWPVVLLGVVNLFGSVALYRGFEQGLLSIVSPVASTCGAFTVLLAVALGRGPGPALGLACLVLLAGVVLVSAVQDGGKQARTVTQQRAGIAWAGVSAVVFGGTFYGLESAGEVVGPVWAVACLRVVAAPLLWMGLATRAQALRAHEDGWSPGPIWLPLLVAVLLDCLGLVVYTWGTQHGDVSLVAMLTSMFSAVTVLLAQRYLHERLSVRQWVGVGLTLAGVAAVIATGS